MNDSNDKRPLLLLDVDGVLNPDFSSKQRSRAVYHNGWVQRKVWVSSTQYRVCVNPTHGRWLRSLAEETGAELAWATTWEHHANRHISPLVGLPTDLRVFPAPIGQKAEHVVPAIGGRRPFAWLDDVERNFTVAKQLASEAGHRFLPLLVNAATGLQESDLEVARYWLREVQEGEHPVVHV